MAISPWSGEPAMGSARVAPDRRGASGPHRAHRRTTLPYQVIYAMDPPRPHLSLYRPLRERRGSQGWSRAPGWPSPGTGGHQLLARGDQLPDSPDRVRGAAAHRGRRCDRAADVRLGHDGCPQHGGRPGTQRSGRHGAVFAAAARDRGPVTIPGAAGPRYAIPGCEPRCVRAESLPGCGRASAGLPARARETSPLLNPEPRLQAGPGTPAGPGPRAGTAEAISRRTSRRRAPGRLGAGWRRCVRVHQRGAADRTVTASRVRCRSRSSNSVSPSGTVASRRVLACTSGRSITASTRLARRPGGHARAPRAARRARSWQLPGRSSPRPPRPCDHHPSFRCAGAYRTGHRMPPEDRRY
jgi:hypothetical protein